MCKIRTDNTFGYTGISWINNINKWEVCKIVNKKRMYIGSFIELEMAVQALNKFLIEHKDELEKCYHKRTKEDLKEFYAKWRNENREKLRAGYKIQTQRKLIKLQQERLEVIKGYGGCCKECGQSNERFLTIEHINGNGKKHREKVGSLYLYKWIIENNFPDSLCLLCWNCNSGGHLIKSGKNVGKPKLQVIEKFGGKCVCCGESRPHMLNLDHIDNNGMIDKKKIGSGEKFYRWLIRNNFPDKNLRLLCWNCNCARKFTEDKKCPHEKEGLNGQK